MTWFRVDDSLPDHPKLIALQGKRGWQGALALWTLAGAWCGKHLTDGRLPAAVVKRLCCTDRDAGLLVEVGLWSRATDGYLFHDWVARNPSRTQIETEREKTRNRVAKHRGNAECNAVTNGVSTPAPSHPIPSQEEEELPPAPDPRRKVTPREAWSAFNRACADAGHALTFTVHPHEASWAAVAESCNAKGKPALALETVCRWYWLAANGPVQSGRVRPDRASPKGFAAQINADIATAGEWLDQQEAAQ